MSERGSSSRTAVRMSIAFMNNAASSSSVEAQPPGETTDNCTARGEASFIDGAGGPYPRQCSTGRGNNLHMRLPGGPDGASSSAAATAAAAQQRTAVRLVTGSFQLAPQQATGRARSDEAGLQHAAHALTDAPEAGSPAAWPAEDALQTSHSSLLVGHHTPTNRWVRFAWEPLAPGGETQRGSSSFSPVVPEAHAFMPAAPAGDTSGATSAAMPLDEFSEVSVSQGHGRLGAKRFRSSSGQVSHSPPAKDKDGNTTQMDERNSGFRTGRGSLDDGRDDRGRTPPALSAHSRSPQSKHAESAVDDGTGQARGAQTPVGAGTMLTRTTRALLIADVAATVGRSSTGAVVHRASFVDGADQKRGCASDGIMPRSRTWGDTIAVATTTREDMSSTRGGGIIGATATGVGTAAVAEHQAQQHQQEQQDQMGGHGMIGSSAKKARYRSLRVRKALSVGHMDSLTNGVSSLGVVSPVPTCDGGSGGWTPVDASTSQSCTRRRQSSTSSARTVCLPRKAAGQTTTLRGRGGSSTTTIVASAGPRADAGASAGAVCASGARGRSFRTTRSRGDKGCAAMGGAEHHQSKKRPREDSVPAAVPPFRSTREHDVKEEAPVFDAAVSMASSPLTTPHVGVCGKGEGKGVAAAMAEGLAGADVNDDDDDNSSDGGAAHEELSVWLHGTDDWWTS